MANTKTEEKDKKTVEEEKKTFDDKLTFDDYVIEKIAALAARDVKGVLELKGGFLSGITEAFSSSTDTNTQGVSVEIDEKNVVIDLKAILEYGQSAPKIFQKVKDTIREQVSEMTGLNVIAVNMKVSDIMTEKEYRQMSEGKE